MASESHHKMQGAKEVQTVQGAMEVVKRLEIWVGAIATTLCRNGRWGERRGNAIGFPKVALYNYSLQRMDGTHVLSCLLY
jgi:hypothetical protein